MCHKAMIMCLATKIVLTCQRVLMVTKNASTNDRFSNQQRPSCGQRTNLLDLHKKQCDHCDFSHYGLAYGVTAPITSNPHNKTTPIRVNPRPQTINIHHTPHFFGQVRPSHPKLKPPMNALFKNCPTSDTVINKSANMMKNMNENIPVRITQRNNLVR